MASESIYDPANNVTHFYDNGNYVGAEPGNVANGTKRDPANVQDYTSKGFGNTTNTDWSKYVKDNISDLIPGLVTMAAPEMKSLSPIKAVLAKMGMATAGGTAADIALNANNDKPKLQSFVDSALNSILGIGVPELANVGLRSNGIMRTSTTMREPTTTSGSSETTRSGRGTSNLTSTSRTESTPSREGPSVYVPGKGAQGQVLFGKNMPGPPIPALTETTTNSTTGNSGSGISNTTREGMTTPGISITQREVGRPGFWGHLLEAVKSVESYKRLNAAGKPILTAPQSALAGILANLGFDVGNRPTQ